MKRYFFYSNRDDDMKFRILDESTIQYLIDFLDDIQLQAAAEDDKVLLKFCQDMINQLINSDEVFDDDEKIKKYKVKDNLWEDDLFKIYDYLTQIKNYTDNPRKAGRKQRKEDENKKSKQKKPYRPHIEDVSEYMSLKEIKEFLLDDPELSNYERFELYYQEHDRIQKEKQRKKDEKGALSYDDMLKELGIEPSSKK